MHAASLVSLAYPGWRRRYTGVGITLVAILVIELIDHFLTQVPTRGAIMLIPVAYAAFTGGLRVGLISAALFCVYAAYAFATPGPPWHYTGTNLLTIGTLSLVGFAMVSMIGILRQQVDQLIADLERRVAERTSQLEAANQAKSSFLSSMSHELRTPLNAILGFTGTLLMKLPGPLTADQEKQLRTVQTSARHLLALINDILDLAKIEAGKLELQMTEVACQEVIVEVVAGLRPLADQKGLPLSVEAPPEPIVCRVDRRALQQILINLITNALKFTDAGKVRVVLAPGVAPGGAPATLISVIDTGAGMLPEDRERLFHAFSQLATPARQAQEGTGLGLYLSYQLAQQLGGTITVESELGVGSTFTLVLPAR